MLLIDHNKNVEELKYDSYIQASLTSCAHPSAQANYAGEGRLACVTSYEAVQSGRVQTYNLFVDLKEFVVPTCSYRMGVPQMGYTAAVISKNPSFLHTTHQD